MAVTIHFHGGPLAGQDQTKDAAPIDITISLYVDPRDRAKGMRHGTYKPDPDSAGGRCYDWQGWG